jgi:hypothetical protein
MSCLLSHANSSYSVGVEWGEQCGAARRHGREMSMETHPPPRSKKPGCSSEGTKWSIPYIAAQAQRRVNLSFPNHAVRIRSTAPPARLQPTPTHPRTTRHPAVPTQNPQTRPHPHISPPALKPPTPPSAASTAARQAALPNAVSRSAQASLTS